jgi:mono/diheme cytochrome c family protein
LCLVLVTSAIVGCRDQEQPVATADPAAARPPSALQPEANPIVQPSLGTPAESLSLVVRGEELFKTKRCARCHTIGEGDRDGPDLAGVTDRRTYDWIIAWLTDTETMLQLDPEAQQMRIEHFKDMPNLELSTTDARGLYAYLRARSPHATAR